jgi:hypothetical protein
MINTFYAMISVIIELNPRYKTNLNSEYWSEPYMHDKRDCDAFFRTITLEVWDLKNGAYDAFILEEDTLYKKRYTITHDDLTDIACSIKVGDTYDIYVDNEMDIPELVEFEEYLDYETINSILDKYDIGTLDSSIASQIIIEYINKKKLSIKLPILDLPFDSGTIIDGKEELKEYMKAHLNSKKVNI